MRRGTTYRLNFKVAADLTGCDEIHIAFQNKKEQIIKKYPELASTIQNEDGSTTVTTVLTQVDTLSFRAGTPVTCQLRCRKGDDAYGTPIYTLTESVDPVIEDAVI